MSQEFLNLFFKRFVCVWYMKLIDRKDIEDTEVIKGLRYQVSYYWSSWISQGKLLKLTGIGKIVIVSGLRVI